MNLYCQNCKKAAAIVHITEIHDGQKVELHFCEECAVAHGLPPKNATVTMFEFLQQWMEKSGSVAKGKDRLCPQCGMSFNDFKVHGRFGCPNDYQVFQSRLIPLLERIHGASGQKGFQPSEAPATTAPTASAAPPKPMQERKLSEPKESVELKKLRGDLHRVVQKEEYEEAAKIRDRIQELEKLLRPHEETDA